ncbi:MAG TPA: 50S ribosomal protein L25/general stress protein Ctc [Pseudomonadales bacterium]|nr:50S ribosomal protein L25/general stress protein Ctc [Pseudomonadales bacterium]
MSDFTLIANAREDMGKGASRRLRHAGLVPGIVYGGKKEAPQMITLNHKDLIKSLENEAFFAHIIELSVDGKKQDVIIKDLQRHPAKNSVVHADFLRVVKGTKITVNVPLHFINEDTCVGVKTQGGRVTHAMNELEISCLPKDLPEFLEVDLKTLEAGHSLHISDIKMPKGVESVALSHGPEHDLPVASVIPPKGGVAAEEGEAEE